MAWDGIDRRKKPKWSLRREFSLGELLTVLALIGGAAAIAKGFELRQDRMEDRMERLERLLCYSIRARDGHVPVDCIQKVPGS